MMYEMPSRRFTSWMFFILFVPSSFFATKLLVLSPVHIALLLFLLLFIFKVFVAKRSYISTPSLFFLAFPIVFIVRTAIFDLTSLKTAIVISLGFLYFVFSHPLVVRLNRSLVLSITFSYLWFTAVLLLFDVAYRVYFPIEHIYAWQERTGNYDVFSAYKNSYMYLDSNITASLTLINIFFILIVSKIVGKQSKSLISIYIFCLISSLSVASIVSFLVFIILFFCFYSRERFLLLASPFFVVFFVFAGMYLFISETDSSFLTKIDIFHDYVIAFQEKITLTQFLFGVGIGRGIEFLGRAPHNILLFFIFETGIIVFSTYLFTIFYIVLLLRWNAFWILGPYLLAGLSAGATATPYLFVIFSVIVRLSNEDSSTCLYTRRQRLSPKGDTATPTSAS